MKNVEYCRESIIKFKKGVEMMDKNNVFIIGDSYSTYDGAFCKSFFGGYDNRKYQ